MSSRLWSDSALQMALGFWTARREMAGIANSLGEIVKVDHHKQNFRYPGQLHSRRQLRQLKFSDMRSLSRAVSQSFGIMHFLSLASYASCGRLGSGDVSKLDPSSRSSRSKETISTASGRPLRCTVLVNLSPDS